FTCREKEFEIDLLKMYGFDFISFGKKYSSTPGKLWGLIKFDVKEYLTGRKFTPDILLSHGSPYAAHAAFFLRRPHISLEDTGNWEQIKLYLPFSAAVLTPDVLIQNLGEKQIKYAGYHELAYLHPSRYCTDDAIWEHLNIERKAPYCLIRFVSWNATHDSRQIGFSHEGKKRIFEYLSDKYKVFISSESKLPRDLEQYRISISPDKMHDVLYHAQLYCGEGATMASEAGVLGTPSIYVNSLVASNCEDQNRYGLVYNFRSSEGVLEKINELCHIKNLKEEWQNRRQKMLADKIDVTAFLVWFIENYPDSACVMRQNPDFQYRFR
ncbi:DUF354 domain-containing protein, partial [candidate division KSB1 bacterium]|nr:DUF354 domain-containing protein [candidate division KSB1 bacterium]